MKTKVFAKLNLTLDILGVENNFHNLKSLCVPINLFDEITVTPRSDKNITVTEKGILSGVKAEDNNAYKTAKAFMEQFNTNGVDIIINKNIFVGGGLGGSSADIAGVLILMSRIFKIENGEKALAGKLGSDVSFMIGARQGVISGKGDKVTYLKNKIKLNALLLYASESMSAKNAYSAFDKEGKTYPLTTDKVVEKIEQGDDSFVLDLTNHLQPSVERQIPLIKENINALKGAGAINALMTGSGSAVFGIFENRKKLNLAFRKLKQKYKNNVVKIKTI